MKRASIVLVITLGCTAEQPANPASRAAPQPPTEDREIEQPKPPEPPEPPEVVPAKDGFFMATGAPEPRACAVAADCLGDTIPDIDNPCCQNPYTLEPYSLAYRAWIGAWRANHCEAVTCPPPPNPSRPPDCAFDVDCVAGVCRDSCD